MLEEHPSTADPHAGVTDHDAWVIVPMLDEARTIGGVVEELRRQFEHVLCIDDGSTDGCGDLARAAGATVVRHPVNLGQGASLQTGFDYLQRHTSATHAVTFDADGQHRVEDAARMARVARERGLDVVLASRFLGQVEDMRTSRRLVLRGAVWFSRRTTSMPLTDTHNGLRVLSRRAFSAIRLRQPRMAYASELENAIVPLGLSWAEEPVTICYTAYSMAKGQHNLNAVNIVFDLAWHKLLSQVA